MAGGGETSYALSLAERWPSLVYSEDPGGTVVPEPLIRRHRKALDDLVKAELEIARWVKFQPPGEAQRLLGPLIDRLGQ